MDAVQQAVKMMRIPRNELPTKALAFSQFLSYKLALCGEVMITAFAVYLQHEEGAVTEEVAYHKDSFASDWKCFEVVWNTCRQSNKEGERE